jgi:hypothetical protein
MTARRTVVWLYWIAALLFLAVALLPIARGDNLNATFLALAVVFFILGMAKARRR